MYQVKFNTYTIGGSPYTIRSLQDLQQFHDPEGTAAALGISSATWSLFGAVWPSGLILADLMSSYDLDGLHCLELGCGLGLASLIANDRGASHIASDYHPLAGEFLAENNRLNHMPPLSFTQCDWAEAMPAMGPFDLIIGSDLLYEPDHPGLLSRFIDVHASSSVKVIIIDPGRRQQGQFTRQMQGLGFIAHADRATSEQAQSREFTGKILHYRRDHQRG